MPPENLGGDAVILTAQQTALLKLIVAGHAVDVQVLIGQNHPTAKWWRRRTGLGIVSDESEGAAKAVLNRDRYISRSHDD